MEKKFADRDLACLTQLDEFLTSLEGEKGALIPVLQKAQDLFGYLPMEVLVYISRKIGVPISRVYGVVTFYSQFHLVPRGRNVIRSCQGTACHVRGASAVMREVRKCLELEGGAATTDNLRFTLESVACIGCCGLAPVMTVNGDTYGRLVPEKVGDILEQYR
ncbi:MAG: NAD(P)H-dependent oxidoreductase subunit E [Synergistaceae bacterium]|jgi:NADH-quinone oxidoreductase subunit E|nr:NAD(P)H-dependent oxidoreductase subunit E [Synergistaceae bacterium]